jgi:hypothetical protein
MYFLRKYGQELHGCIFRGETDDYILPLKISGTISEETYERSGGE